MPSHGNRFGRERLFGDGSNVGRGELQKGASPGRQSSTSQVAGGAILKEGDIPGIEQIKIGNTVGPSSGIRRRGQSVL